MAQTIRVYEGTGAATVYDVDFSLGYLRRDDVYVYTGDDYTLNAIAHVWVNAGQIQCTVSAGVSFNVRRVVTTDAPINDYEDGAILRDKNLDDSFAQSLMILEELNDGFKQPVGGEQQNLEMNQFRVVNSSDAIDPNDLPNLAQTGRIVDQRLQAFDPESYIDYGLITEEVDDEQDYGGLS